MSMYTINYLYSTGEEKLTSIVQEQAEEINRLAAINAELFAALQIISEVDNYTQSRLQAQLTHVKTLARAALAKANHG